MRHDTSELGAAEAARRAGIPIPDPDVPVRVAPAWLRACWGRGIVGITLPGRILLDPATFAAVRAGDDPELLAHELAHLRQWRRLGRGRFLRSYLGDYLRARLAGLSHEAAYRTIRLEREAERAAQGIVP